MMFKRLAEVGIDGVQRDRPTPSKPRHPLDLVEETKRAFSKFAPDVTDALVFLDHGAVEQAHYACSAAFLLGLGARNVLALPKAGRRGVTPKEEDAHVAEKLHLPGSREDCATPVRDVAGVETGTCCTSQIPTLFAHTRLTLFFHNHRSRHPNRGLHAPNAC